MIARKAGQAVHVLDRYHIMAKMNKAIDEVRAAEAKAPEAEGRAAGAEARPVVPAEAA